MIIIITAATSTYLLLTPRGEVGGDEWYWDYLDMKARGVLKILLDDSLPLCHNLTGREVIYALFSPEVLQPLHTTPTHLFTELLTVLSICAGNETYLHLEVRRGNDIFSGGVVGEERAVRGATLEGGVEVKVAVTPLGGGS